MHSKDDNVILCVKKIQILVSRMVAWVPQSVGTIVSHAEVWCSNPSRYIPIFLKQVVIVPAAKCSATIVLQFFGYDHINLCTVSQ